MIAINIALFFPEQVVSLAKELNSLVRETYHNDPPATKSIITFEDDHIKQGHHPHVTLFQCFIERNNLNSFIDTVNPFFEEEEKRNKIFKDFHLERSNVISNNMGDNNYVLSLSVKVPHLEELRKFQTDLKKEIDKFIIKEEENNKEVLKEAFFKDSNDEYIEDGTLSYVLNFHKSKTNQRFHPHITVGVGQKSAIDHMILEEKLFAQQQQQEGNVNRKKKKKKSTSFTFSIDKIGICQIGNHGTCRDIIKLYGDEHLPE
ncbi:hypothetical protein ABK040_014245 [Willaertia magna]